MLFTVIVNVCTDTQKVVATLTKMQSDISALILMGIMLSYIFDRLFRGDFTDSVLYCILHSNTFDSRYS